jgi:hypothetical protein
VSKPRVIKGIAALLVLAGLGGAAWLALNPGPTAPAAQNKGAEGAKAQEGVKYRPVHVIAALKEGAVEMEMRGDGHGIVQVTAANRGQEPLELVFQSGMALISDNQMAEALLPREQSIFLKAGEARRVNLEVAPGSCRNERKVRPYLVSLHRYEVLEPFWDYLSQHPEVGPEAVRTAVLIVKENLPLSAFAKFPLSSGAKPETVREAGLEVETREIMEALMALQRAGYPPERLAILVDPQLQLEALLEPLTRPAAKRYFAMTDADEWTYWENHLKKGSPSTRHYALYAIARFYPEVATQMLPRWARFQDISMNMRRSAILALAEVRRPEAAGLLQQLEDELGASPALGATVTQAFAYRARHVRLSQGIEGLAFQTGGEEDHGELRGGAQLAAASTTPASTAQVATAPQTPATSAQPPPLVDPEVERRALLLIWGAHTTVFQGAEALALTRFWPATAPAVHLITGHLTFPEPEPQPVPPAGLDQPIVRGLLTSARAWDFASTCALQPLAVCTQLEAEAAILRWALSPASKAPAPADNKDPLAAGESAPEDANYAAAGQARAGG